MDWKDLTVNQYEQLAELHKIDRTRFASNAIEVMFGVKNADTTLPLVEYSRYLGELSFFSTPMPKGKLKEHHTLNGRAYDVSLVVAEFSSVQYQDIMNYSKGDKRLTDMLSCVVIPHGHRYNDGYDLEQVKDDIGTMNVVDGSAIAAFFLTFWKAYMRTFRAYSLPRLMSQLPKEKKEEVERLTKELLEKWEALITA